MPISNKLKRSWQMNRNFIYRIENSRKKDLLNLSPLEEKDGGLFCSYTRNVTAQIAQAQTEQEMRAVCLAINEYIEKKGIDICYVVNENVLNDLLHNHEQLYKQLYSTEEQNKRVLEKLEIITRYNQELEARLVEQSRREIIISARQGGKTQTIKIKLKQIQNEKAIEELKKVKETMSNSDESGYLIRFSTMGDREKFNNVIDQQIKALREVEND